MIRIVTLSALLSLSPLVALAQTAPLPSVESVVVTGTRSPKAMEDFVGEVGQPTRIIGKLARWEVPICVGISGLNPSAVAFLETRIKEVAAGAGARINHDAKCRPNLQVLFTTTPQKRLTDIRKTKRALLGYFDTMAQLDRLATFRGPIRAWYMTATTDIRGHLQTDNARTEGIELKLQPHLPKVWLPNARSYAASGSRLGDGLRASLQQVTIIADPTKLLDEQMGPVADYLAMMSLSHMQSPDRCQSLPTIANLLVADCPRIPQGLSDIDLGYLRGLYRMDAERAKGVQLHQIIYQMQREVLKDE